MHHFLALMKFRNIKFFEGSYALHFVFESGFVIVHGLREVLNNLLISLVIILMKWIILELIGRVLDGHAEVFLGDHWLMVDVAKLVFFVGALYALLPRLLVVDFVDDFVHYVIVNYCIRIHDYDTR